MEIERRHPDSWLLVNAINKKIKVSKDNINLVEEIKYLLFRFSENKLEYYNRVINRDADVLVKIVHL